jgi:alpha-tubulin suppressor-like RCC1 family protein
VQVQGLSGVTTLVGGFSYTVALKSDGTLWTWGDNHYGQLGNAITSPYYRATPGQVTTLSNATDIAAGYYHAVALKSDGTVWTWGYNPVGQLGDGTTTDSATPVKVKDLLAATAIEAGYLHTLAKKADGTLWGWGSNFVGQLGSADTETDRTSPAQIVVP